MKYKYLVINGEAKACFVEHSGAVFSLKVCFLIACEPETTRTHLNNILMFV